ncbi:MAG TPA: FHA domain-containing protein, partial [Phycisphaerales bacterium]|nr:FHA domain-containing protein [Phycisphaerales bacterium]
MPQVDIRRAQRISVHEVGNAPVKVGRLTDNDLVLRNIHVSRHHCVIEKVDGTLRVRDLDSQSGTWVNGDRIDEAVLYAGDRISVGPFDLVLRAAPEDVDFISRNSALDEALKHVTVDDDTGLPVEGPAALVDDLKKQLETERKQHRKTAAQVAGLLQQVDDLQAQMAASERSGLLLHEEQPPASDERVAELEEALAEAQVRAVNAERQRADALTARVEELELSLQS